MCLQNLPVLVSPEQLVRQCHQIEDVRFERVASAVGEHVQPQLQPLAVIALIVRELYQHDDLHDGVEGRVPVFVGLSIHNFLEHFLEVSCGVKRRGYDV